MTSAIRVSSTPYTHYERNGAGDLVLKFGERSGGCTIYPGMFETPTASIASMLLEERRDAIAAREMLLDAQKGAAAAGDRHGAKMLKALARDQMRRYRAACLYIPHFVCDPPGDCTFASPGDWPVELAFELVQVGTRISVS